MRVSQCIGGSMGQNISTEAIHPRPQALENLERLVLVTGNYINVADGAALTLHRIVEDLQARQVQVLVVAPDDADPVLIPPAQLITPPSVKLPVQGYRLSLGAGRHLEAALDEFSPQLVHVATPDLLGRWAIHYARQRGLPLTSTFHTNFAAYLRYWGILPAVLTPLAWELKRRIYASFDRVYVPTPSMGQELIAHGVLEDYALLARGVDSQRFHPTKRSERWRQSIGIAPERPVILFCARIVWEKGLRTLVDALQLVERHGPAHEVLIVGDGAQLKWLKKALPSAHFTGFLEDEALATAYASADIFLYPSTTDTFGNVTLEALASGLPVVGARAPGTRCIVGHGESGFLVTPDDEREFARRTIWLLRNHSARQRMGWAARCRAESYCWPQILSAFARDLDGLVGSRAH